MWRIILDLVILNIFRFDFFFIWLCDHIIDNLSFWLCVIFFKNCFRRDLLLGLVWNLLYDLALSYIFMWGLFFIWLNGSFTLIIYILYFWLHFIFHNYFLLLILSILNCIICIFLEHLKLIVASRIRPGLFYVF